MTKWEYYHIMKRAGYTWEERYQLLKNVEEDRRYPTSRKKANRMLRTTEILNDVGIDPIAIEFDWEKPAII